MEDFDQIIQRLASRTPSLGKEEQKRMASMFAHFTAINRFEGIYPSETDKQLFDLLATGKISKQEYIDLCVNDARSAEI